MSAVGALEAQSAVANLCRRRYATATWGKFLRGDNATAPRARDMTCAANSSAGLSCCCARLLAMRAVP